jgi:hypothetical protein
MKASAGVVFQEDKFKDIGQELSSVFFDKIG